jgi:hypothetical protein
MSCLSLSTFVFLLMATMDGQEAEKGAESRVLSPAGQT